MPSAASAPVSQQGRIALLQAYRGLVALLIAWSHLGIALNHAGSDALRWVNAVGRVGGVDFFFVLSGFLIYRTYAQGPRLVPCGQFLGRRLLRIYPLVWIFTAASLPVYLLASGWGLGDGHEMEAGRIMRSLLLWPDVMQPILGATWSLRHVVAFYVVFAAFLRWPSLVAHAALIWAAAVLLLSLAGVAPPYPAELAFLLQPFNLTFLCGCLLAVWLRGRVVRVAPVWLAAGVALFVFTWITRGELGGWGMKLPLYMAGACALIIGAQGLEQRRALVLPRWIDLLGDASYAMIVVNLPVALAAGKVLGAVGLMRGWHVWWAIPLMLVLVVGASIFTHLAIEKPVTRWLSARIARQPRSVMPQAHLRPSGYGRP